MDKIATSLQEIHEHVEQHPLPYYIFLRRPVVYVMGYGQNVGTLIPIPRSR